VRNRLATHSRDLAFAIVNSALFPRRLRARAWSALGHVVHPTALLDPCTFVGGLTGLEIGAHTYINRNCFIDLSAPVIIGDGCVISLEVALITSSHEISNATRRAGAVTARSIEVGNGTWIGARATVLPGVTIGSGCIVAAGAVVVRDCEPNGVYAGVPARRIRDL